MKKPGLFIIIALMAGLLAFYLMRSHQMKSDHDTMLDSMPELAWVKSEFKLSDEQFASVSQLHASYRPHCKEMCERIANSSRELERLCQAQRSMTPEVESAVTAHANLQLACQKEMLKHIYQTSSLLDPDQGERYLKAMLPHVFHISRGQTKHHAH